MLSGKIGRGKMKKRFFILIIFLFVTQTAQIFGEALIINSNQTDNSTRTAVQNIVDLFAAQHPEIKVQLNTVDHEKYKTSISNWLVHGGADVLFWFAGERMKGFVDHGLLEPLNDIWNQQQLHRNMASSRSLITFDGKQYGIPYAYYHWGIYYRKDLFQRYQLSVPQTWEQLLKICHVLKQNQIVPFTIGTKYNWTAAAWFDYLNLRMNGLEFHKQLMSGTVPYTHPQVKNVFKTWQTLISAGYFIKRHHHYSWQDAQAFLYQGEAAMYLMGNFMVPHFRAKGLEDKMGFFPFPTIQANLPSYEEAPTDILVIPTKAKHKVAARQFLTFVSQPQILRQFNDQSETLSPHRKSKAKDDLFLQAGFNLLEKAEGLAQFYDRDTRPEMATVGMKMFQQFMVSPSQLDKILLRLESVRHRVFDVKN